MYFVAASSCFPTQPFCAFLLPLPQARTSMLARLGGIHWPISSSSAVAGVAVPR